MWFISAPGDGLESPFCGVLVPTFGDEPPYWQTFAWNPVVSVILMTTDVQAAGGLLDTHEISCVVGDDHEALRRGLVAVLEAEVDLRVIGQAADGRALVELAERRRPDVTIVDEGMTSIDGIESCRRVTAQPHPTPGSAYTRLP